MGWSVTGAVTGGWRPWSLVCHSLTDPPWRLQSATAGKLTVPDPGPRTRGRWRASYYDALHHGHVPAGHKLRWTGRQRGDCVFTLVDEEAEKAAQPAPVPTIDVPAVLDRPHRLVRATRKACSRSKTVVDTRGTPEVIPLHVSREQVDRALRIMHAFLTEAESRGYQVETRTDLQRGKAVHQLVIVVRGHALPLALTERTTKVPHDATPQEIRQQQRNPWTKIPAYDHEFDGRLELGAPAGSWYQYSYSYRDGARWTLESRLGHLLRDLEDRAAAAERREQEEELRKAEQRRRWYAAVAEARKLQVERHRAKVLAEQAEAWHQADKIRNVPSRPRWVEARSHCFGPPPIICPGVPTWPAQGTGGGGLRARAAHRAEGGGR
ncbi:hypothetical protein [Streptomyces sp. NPDC049585]|uniref:hypothetical protein n=1 Tax=Streptomyces sp. NPDC049585 TaxID=3155154 RepID=UPI00341694D4